MTTRDFRGNKADLPSKPCRHCARAMSWRKAWRNNWDAVQYCSTRCRNAQRRQARLEP